MEIWEEVTSLSPTLCPFLFSQNKTNGKHLKQEADYKGPR